MVLDVPLLNTQYCKVRIKGKLINLRKWLAPNPTLSIVAIRKGTYVLLSVMIGLYIYIYIIFQ